MACHVELAKTEHEAAADETARAHDCQTLPDADLEAWRCRPESAQQWPTRCDGRPVTWARPTPRRRKVTANAWSVALMRREWVLDQTDDTSPSRLLSCFRPRPSSVPISAPRATLRS
jgi:hypothetical protein